MAQNSGAESVHFNVIVKRDRDVIYVFNPITTSADDSLKKYFHCFSVVVVALLFYVHGKHLRSCRDGQST